MNNIAKTTKKIMKTSKDLEREGFTRVQLRKFLVYRKQIEGCGARINVRVNEDETISPPYVFKPLIGKSKSYDNFEEVEKVIKNLFKNN